MKRTAEMQRDELRLVLGATLALMEIVDPERFGEFIDTAQKVLDRIADEEATA